MLSSIRISSITTEPFRSTGRPLRGVCFLSSIWSIISLMELTSKQRAYLRGEAQTIDPIVMIGKDGLTENVTAALDEALTHHELVKVKFQQYKEDVKEIAFICAELTSSVLVATTGFTAVFYRMKEKSEERIYSLPR